MYKSKCKSCEHGIHFGFCPVAFLDWNMDGDPGEPMWCDCEEYIPSDNLEYLEYKYVRRRVQV